ncbi:MAG: C-GCAxxG-C-C family protein [Eubacterium sp.]
MMMEKMTTDFACDCFANGIDCSQVVFGYAAEKLGFDADTARKIAAAFGGGMWHGETCGCVVGALMAIGLKCGHVKKAMPRQNRIYLQKNRNLKKNLLQNQAA